MYRTKNPALNDMVFVFNGMLGDKMTIQGVVEKGAITFAIMLLSGLSIWGLALTGSPELAFTLSMVGWVVGFIFFFVMLFTGLADNPIAVLTYAALQGLFLGGTTLIFESAYPGIAIQAFLGTTAVFGGMLIIYRTGVIPVTENFRIALFSAMSAIFMIYMLTLILSIFGIEVPYIHSNGPIGIGFSVLVIGLGAFCLASDFDFVERGVENGAPKSMEWRAVFGLMVTLIWIYLEMLRLLAKLNSRR
ncbi:MAG: Bax inhibitor-1/YccA family protein [Candidatus Thermoplasmatota archaeon]|nr:Bax inhibitor-1/YccA family protein [Candidatus Thermoplasmatota archaeon]MEC8384698.1 Bax inhibitor-1/YccA family protein [Candidatus Thermoplasmatota archaeon]MEC9117973.1 Bax inhibitor-1/YccA family protein [Candidatus Thermoplasmatota archaeon]MED5375005.1 Bax inhibitor-1/YccA family protein [Candidatus Thermoplasmatota archaeon]